MKKQKRFLCCNTGTHMINFLKQTKTNHSYFYTRKITSFLEHKNSLWLQAMEEL